MKKSILILFNVILVSVLANGQITFKSGSADLDKDLNNINIEAKANLKIFKSDLEVKFNASKGDVELLFDLKMEPAEVYLAFEINKITKQPISSIADCYKGNKDKGWGYIAKQMGIKPGSPEFHQLKGNAKKSKNNKANNGKGKGKSNGKKK